MPQNGGAAEQGAGAAAAAGACSNATSRFAQCQFETALQGYNLPTQSPVEKSMMSRVGHWRLCGGVVLCAVCAGVWDNDQQTKHNARTLRTGFRFPGL